MLEVLILYNLLIGSHNAAGGREPDNMWESLQYRFRYKNTILWSKIISAPVPYPSRSSH